MDLIKSRTNKVLQGLTPLLKSWTGVVMDYCRSDQFDDNPWWYNERASLSTLAGAAWRLKGWQALEEFSTTKRGIVPGAEDNPDRVKRGRCDLYVAHGTTSFAIEAKQAWQPVSRGFDHIDREMSKALIDAGNLTADQADHRIAVAFTAPYIPLRQVAAEGSRGKLVVIPKIVHEKVAVWLKDANLQGYDGYAYVFPKRCELFVTPKSSRVFPGVLLTIKRCKTGTRTMKSA